MVVEKTALEQGGFFYGGTMSKLAWLFAWAKEQNISIPLSSDGSADIAALLELYNGETTSSKSKILVRALPDKLKAARNDVSNLRPRKVYYADREAGGWRIRDDSGRLNVYPFDLFERVQ